MQENSKIKKAVALDYEKGVDSAPKVVAKAKGEAAKNIIKIANENQIPIKKDEDLVELLSKIDIGKEIPNSIYKAVAEIFAFIYELSNEKKGREK
ncbi:EscU/YscU/HrcU family type III secretion system export apparatus switch protein [Arcobacter porcinus]|uniref:EscU/YscU/HrcU family type III secretion system export apparatus switch protein n=1 Tax=Arcobacter porcinus TaxID=1935204 RepID=UPI0008250EC4|nr:EscU/YscU/HrcU family type III secretion system export apparatus switch protein [Arcobacter porcinus]OCL85649.1 Flagellar biosynthetic protein FlhB [Arcobacter porcinus]